MLSPRSRILPWQALRILWASPWSLVGVGLGLGGLATGARMARQGLTLEFTGGGLAWLLERGTPIGAIAITLGHVVLARSQTAAELARAHERVHVEQYERWGPLFVPAYFLCSAWLWLRGARPYLDNPFERDARHRCGE